MRSQVVGSARSETKSFELQAPLRWRVAQAFHSEAPGQTSYDNIVRPVRKRSAVKGTLIGVRLQAFHLKALDAWIAQQTTPFTRPEAIRAMMETILHILSKDTGEKPIKKAKGK